MSPNAIPNVETPFVRSPGRVADQLEQFQEATGAGELIVTTMTHDHADRVAPTRCSPMNGTASEPITCADACFARPPCPRNAGSLTEPVVLADTGT